MNYSQIRAFHYVAMLRGFSRAAEALSLTQPAISEQVRKLESDNDILLFNRERKQITLTPLAEDLLLKTKQLFELEDTIDDILSERRSVLTGHLRIMVDSAFHLSDRLLRFRQKYPEVKVTVRTGNSEDVLANLRSYDVEIGIVGSENPGSEFEKVSLGEADIVAVAAKPFVVETEKRLTMQDLKGFPLVFREPGSKTRQKLERAAMAEKVTLKPEMVVEGREAMLEVVASGTGLGFVSEAEIGNDPRLTRIDLAARDLKMAESLVYLKQRSDLRVIRSFLRS